MSKGLPLGADAGAEEDRPAARAANLLGCGVIDDDDDTGVVGGDNDDADVEEAGWGGVWNRQPEMDPTRQLAGGLAGHLLLA